MVAKEDPAKHLALALQHKAAALDAARAVLRERELRAELVDKVFIEPKLGMNTHDFGGGHVLKVEYRPAPKFEEQQLLAGVDLIRQSGELGAELAGRLVKMTPELRIGEYNKLPEQFAELLEGVVVIGKSSPSVKLEVPA